MAGDIAAAAGSIDVSLSLISARHMMKQGSGVILALNSGSARGSPMIGSTGPAPITATFVNVTGGMFAS